MVDHHTGGNYLWSGKITLNMKIAASNIRQHRKLLLVNPATNTHTQKEEK